MRCQAVRKSLDLFIRQELEPQRQSLVEAHLNGCAECRRELARQQRLAGLLASAAPPPPLREGFRERLIAAACQRQAERRPVPGSIWRFRWRSPGTPAANKAVQAAALAGGLLLGFVMGHHAWRSVHSSMPPQSGRPDPLAVFQLDYLTDAPGSSLARSYLTLTGAPGRNGT